MIVNRYRCIGCGLDLTPDLANALNLSEYRLEQWDLSLSEVNQLRIFRDEMKQREMWWKEYHDLLGEPLDTGGRIGELRSLLGLDDAAKEK